MNSYLHLYHLTYWPYSLGPAWCLKLPNLSFHTSEIGITWTVSYVIIQQMALSACNTSCPERGVLQGRELEGKRACKAQKKLGPGSTHPKLSTFLCSHLFLLMCSMILLVSPKKPRKPLLYLHIQPIIKSSLLYFFLV